MRHYLSNRKNRFNKIILYPLSCVFIALLIVQGVNAQDAANGKKLFDKNCAVCHKLSDEKLVGPGLQGVNDRREKDWLVKFIRNSKEMIESGDPVAVQVYEENNKVEMTSFKNLKEEEIGDILQYIADYDPDAAKKSVIADFETNEFNETQIQRGERLFKGLIPFEHSTANCSSCHNTVDKEEFSWNPTVLDIAEKNEREGGNYIFNVLKNPVSQVMQKTHAGLEYTDEEIFYIKAYLHHIAEHGMEKAKKFPMDLMIFLGFGFLMTLALIDLIITRKIKYRVIHVIILIVGVIFQIQIVSYEAVNLSRTQNYQPDQPIKFSHAIHAGDNQIDCEYCHSSVTNSKSAGIPPASLCMNCHMVVREGTNSGKFEIDKIYAALENNDPIEWIKVHNLPDHVFFSHAQHVGVGGITCDKCHGTVEEMDVLKQVEDLSMGWCINCHRETKVKGFDDNEYYETYMKLHDDLKSGKLDSITVEDIGGLDCMKCHY